MGAGGTLRFLTKSRYIETTSLAGDIFLAATPSFLPDHSMFFPENDQEQPSESSKAKDCFCFFFQLNLRPLLSVFSSQLSTAVSAQDEEETVTIISPPNQREMNDSPQHHAI